MRKPIVALGAVVLLIGGGQVALGHETSTPTTVEIREIEENPAGTFRVYGDLVTKRKCRANRRVKVFFDYIPINRGPFPTEWTLVDVDRSSDNGMWGGSGPVNETTGSVRAIRILATRKNVGRRGHSHICRADTETQLVVPES